MRVTTEGYGVIVQQLSDVAARHGALAMVTEGGYDLPSLTACLEQSVAVLSGSSAAPRLTTADAARGARAVAAARTCLKPFWPVL